MDIKKFVFFKILFILTLSLHAQTFTQEATYLMGDDDSKLSAKNKAILIAKRECIEKAGVYVSSYSKSIKGILRNDTIESFSASIMTITILENKFKYPSYWVKVKAEIDINLLNKKIEQFNNLSVHVEDQIKSASDEIKEYNRKLNELIKTRNKKKELKNLQETKKVLIRKVNDLVNNKDIQFDKLEDKNYAYLNIASNIEDSEVYINGTYIGIAPIKNMKVKSGEEITIKGINDKRYYPKDISLKSSFKKLSSSSINLNFIRGEAELFFIGEENVYIYINGLLKQKLKKDNKIVKIKAGKDIQITLKHATGCFISNEDVWANNTYEIFFTLDKRKCSLVKDYLLHKGTLYKMLVSPYTGKVWLDRNIGASRVCLSSNDEECYGDYFQWGRDDDGHEKVNTPTRKISFSDAPRDSLFIIGNQENNYNWLNNEDNNLWQLSKINNPCPDSFRVPSAKEILAETRNTTIEKNNLSSFTNFLKFPFSGYRYRKNGLLSSQGASLHLWTSSTNSHYAKSLFADKKSIEIDNSLRGNGYSLRCIKE